MVDRNCVTALRIQVSEQCKDLLGQLGVYEFDNRGQVEVKVGHRSFIHILLHTSPRVG